MTLPHHPRSTSWTRLGSAALLLLLLGCASGPQPSRNAQVPSTPTTVVAPASAAPVEERTQPELPREEAFRGHLPTKMIHQVVSNHAGDFRACYEQELRRDPLAAGRVTITFVIEADGSVRRVSTSQDENLSDAMLACVEEGFRNLTFPAPDGGPMSVISPLQFRPKDPK